MQKNILVHFLYIDLNALGK